MWRGRMRGRRPAALFVLANDFDPDGGGITLVEVSTPANGTVSFNGSCIIDYIPNAGFSGVETITYTIRDNEGLTATGTLTVWVDTGTFSSAQSPNPQTDYFYVYQGSSVGFTTAQLLDNDVDPNTSPSPSWPCRNPPTTAPSPAPSSTASPTPPASPPASSAPTSNSTTSSPTPTATSPKRTSPSASSPPATPTAVPVARADVARTNAGTSTGGAVRARQRLRSRRRQRHPGRGVHPRQRHRVVQRQLHLNYIPNAGFSGVETITYTIRDNEGLTATGTLTVWVDTGTASRPSHRTRRPTTSTSTKAPRSASPPRNSSTTTSTPTTSPSPSWPCRNPPTTAPSPAPWSTASSTPPASPPASSAPTSNSTTSSPTPTATSPKRTSPSASSPPATPTPSRWLGRMWRGRMRGRRPAALFVLANDFDPDGGSVTLVEVSTPANGTVSFSGSCIINYIPNAGFSGVETITYTIRDNEGLTATGTLTVWVDTGTASSAQSPDPQTDYFYVYQGSSVGFTTAQLLDNDIDPQRQALTVVAVSEPSNNGTLTGTLVDGFAYTPGLAAGLVGTDIQLNYLVTDTDGHVTQENITIRILAAGDTNPIPVAVPDTAQTNAGSSTGSAVRARQRLRSRRRQHHPGRGVHPRQRHRVVQRQLHLTTSPTPGSPASKPSPTPSATTKASPPPDSSRCSSARRATGRRWPSRRATRCRRAARCRSRCRRSTRTDSHSRGRSSPRQSVS